MTSTAQFRATGLCWDTDGSKKGELTGVFKHRGGKDIIIILGRYIQAKITGLSDAAQLAIKEGSRRNMRYRV